jgi:glutamate-1-semialdehyde aminotransferase
MGAINYKNSDWVTVGVKMDDFYNNAEELEENDIYYDKDYEIENLFEEIQEILSKYDFYYMHVELVSGYYDGFYIDIENNFEVCYEDTYEKAAALKEVTQLKKFLLECIDNGLLVCFSSWVTTWLSVEESKAKIKESIKLLKEYIKDTPTYKQYFKGGF